MTKDPKDPKDPKTTQNLSRRDFLARSALGAGALYGVSAGSHRTGRAQSPERQLGIALVGLGNYATNQLAPALQQTRLCRLAGIVTGTPAKAGRWKQQYGIPERNVYDYESFDRIAENPEIDIVYVVLPNSMHAEYTIRAARAGKHVICEKPMSVSVSEAEEMIAACRRADRQLAIGYRLHFEPYNLEMKRLGQQRVFGPVKLINSQFGFPLRNRSAWRLHHAMAGGGPLMDVGIYCIQAARYVTGEEPTAITAQEVKTEPEIFQDVEETLTWQMEFPSGCLANCGTSYATYTERLECCAERGWFALRPAFGYGPLAGETSEGPLEFPQVAEQAPHMDAIASAILEGKPNPVPGEEGLRDMRIIEAIYRASRTGERVEL